jgi:ribosome biogenesis protein SSF1/2
MQTLTFSTGAQIKQTARLHDHGRTAGRHTSDAILEVRVWKHKHEACNHPARPYLTFSRRELQSLQGRLEVAAASQKLKAAVHDSTSRMHSLYPHPCNPLTRHFQLVMNNFTTQPTAAKDTESSTAVPKHLESLVTTIFQTLFPPLNPQTTPLPSIKRILLLNREPPSSDENNAYTITLRHYAINTKATGLPKSLKRLNNAEKKDKSEKKAKGMGVPNLGKLDDVADFFLGGDAGEGNYTSASESEVETDAEVEVLAPRTKKILSKSQRERLREAQATGKTHTFSSSSRVPGVEKRSIQLKELGPRMRLKLIKVEEGLCGGKIMWHDFLQKTKEEELELEKKWSEKKRAKEERKRIQRENVQKKKKEGRGSGKGGEEDEDGDVIVDEDGEEFWDSEDDGEGWNGVDEDDDDEEMEDGG